MNSTVKKPMKLCLTQCFSISPTYLRTGLPLVYFAVSTINNTWNKRSVERPVGNLNFGFEQRNDIIRLVFQKGNSGLCLKVSL